MRVRFLLPVILFLAHSANAAPYPQPKPGDFTMKDFVFTGGEKLPEVRIHYRTLGQPRTDAAGHTSNAVLIMHGTTGSGENFLSETFGGVVFCAGCLLDATKYYIIIPDGLGHGKSSKPSDGLHARFPRYGYEDMTNAQYRLVTEGLHVDHLRLVMGTSMGGMHTWMWGEKYPDFMDALVPLACLPVQIAGRNRAWRKMGIDAIRNDAAYSNGDYSSQPQGLKIALQLLWLVSNNPVQRQKDAPTRAKADTALDTWVAERLHTYDANDTLYALDASYDYNPQPKLAAIKAPLLAINFADDLINPPELGILEKEIKTVPHGREVLVPLSDVTRGHGTHSLPAVYGDQFAQFLKETEPRK
jgi:homoserine O-acetyltransferase